VSSVQNVIHSKDSPRGFAVVRLLARVRDSLDIGHLVPMPAIGVNTFVFDGFGLLAHLLACRNIEHLAPLPAICISTPVFARMEHLAPRHNLLSPLVARQALLICRESKTILGVYLPIINAKLYTSQAAETVAGESSSQTLKRSLIILLQFVIFRK